MSASKAIIASLELKLEELSKLSVELCNAPSDIAFSNNYTHENGLDKDGYDAERELLMPSYDAKYCQNKVDIESVKVAIAEYKKQARIEGVMELIGG